MLRGEVKIQLFIKKKKCRCLTTENKVKYEDIALEWGKYLDYHKTFVGNPLKNESHK